MKGFYASILLLLSFSFPSLLHGEETVESLMAQINKGKEPPIFNSSQERDNWMEKTGNPAIRALETLVEKKDGPEVWKYMLSLLNENHRLRLHTHLSIRRLNFPKILSENKEIMDQYLDKTLTMLHDEPDKLYRYDAIYLLRILTEPDNKVFNYQTNSTVATHVRAYIMENEARLNILIGALKDPMIEVRDNAILLLKTVSTSLDEKKKKKITDALLGKINVYEKEGFQKLEGAELARVQNMLKLLEEIDPTQKMLTQKFRKEIATCQISGESKKKEGDIRHTSKTPEASTDKKKPKQSPKKSPTSE